MIELGLNHEQQHQELILTDIKHALAQNPLRPAYRDGVGASATLPRRCPWSGSTFPAGSSGSATTAAGLRSTTKARAIAFILEPFQLGSRLVTSGEFLAFIDDGGYARPELWLSDGWNVVNAQRTGTPRSTGRETAASAGS